MFPRPLVLPMFLAAALLGGCSPKAADGGGSGATAASPAAVAATPSNVVLTPKGAPQRRDGYWEMESFSASGSSMTKQFLCVGAGSENKFSVFDALAIVGDCSKKDFTRTATGWTFETRCELMKTVTVQKGTISGDFQQSFLIDQTVTQGPDTEIKGTIRGKRVGDCAAKYKPGDLVDKDGDVIGNMLG